MWLLNAETLKLESFFDSSIPPYAILSHTWGEGGQGEVTFQEIMTPAAQSKPGYTKIEYACRQTIADGLNHVWIDTCCIDKSSSAELTEAINSMFRLYRDARVCYAYLEDVSGLYPFKDEANAIDQWHRAFARSRWFKRGWTLQELVAPRKVLFYGQRWNILGSKQELMRTISRVTRVDESVLSGALPLSEVSIAKRMSWAAERITSRVEDEAYSLLGIFDVNMPMLYGEGARAFTRLQEEIIKTSTDHSIFAWEAFGAHEGFLLLAPSTRNFVNGYKVIRWYPSSQWSGSCEMTNQGLRAKLPILETEWKSMLTRPLNVAILNCRFQDDFLGPIALRLAVSPYASSEIRGDEFVIWPGAACRGIYPRVSVVDYANLTSANKRDFIILREPPQLYLHRLLVNPKFWFRLNDDEDLTVVDVYPRESWNVRTGVVSPPETIRGGSVLLHDRYGRSIIVAFAYSSARSYRPQMSRSSSSLSRQPFHEAFQRGVEIFGDEDNVTLKEACVDCLLKSRTAVKTLNNSEEVTATIEEEEIMNERVFVVRVSVGQSGDARSGLLSLTMEEES